LGEPRGTDNFGTPSLLNIRTLQAAGCEFVKFDWSMISRWSVVPGGKKPDAIARRLMKSTGKLGRQAAKVFEQS
jgi:hypothetical protein